MSYQPRGHWKTLPKTTDVRGFTPSGYPGQLNRSGRRHGQHGGQGHGPLAHVRLLAAGPRRRSQDPTPWQTGTGTYVNGERNPSCRIYEAEVRALAGTAS